jgi:hypothetical protein
MKTFTMKEIETMLKMEEAINAVHNHELYHHTITDNTSLILSIINTIAIVYIVYKLNTNKNG